jgi:hypothetical protein
MLTLLIWILTTLSAFAPAIYGQSTWYKAEVLVAGAILATGKRRQSAVWRVMGLSTEGNGAMYQRDPAEGLADDV